MRPRSGGITYFEGWMSGFSLSRAILKIEDVAYLCFYLLLPKIKLSSAVTLAFAFRVVSYFRLGRSAA